MVHQNDGVPVCDQIVHDPGQPHNVRGVQTDGGLIQHIQDAGGAVADSTGQLHSLALAGGERRRCAVKRQVAQAQIHQPLGGALKRLANTLGHRAHVFRQAAGNAPYPVHQSVKRHGAGFIQRNTPKPWRTGSSGQACAVACRANILFQKLFHPLHALFVLDLGQCIFHGVNRVIIGKIKLSRLIGFLRLVKNMLLDRWAMIDDLFLFCGQVTEWYLRTDPHFTAHVGHQRPHQAVPRSNCALINAEGVIRHKACHIDGSDAAGAATLLTSPLRIERQFLSRRCIKMRTARRTNKLSSCCDSQGRFHIMPIGAAVAGKAGIHQPQAV